MSYRKTFLYIISSVLLATLTFYPKSVFAYLQENFNTFSLNTAYWSTVRSSGISYDGVGIHLSQYDSHSFPYIYSQSPIILETNNVVEFRFRYEGVGGYGNGIAITDTLPPVNNEMFYPNDFVKYAPFYVWQNNAFPYFHIATSLCSESDSLCNSNNIRVIYNTATIDLNPHTVKFERRDDHYYLYLDENLLFVSAPTLRFFNKIWIGHPSTMTNSNPWSSFFVDYIYVNASIFPHYLSQKDPLWAGVEYDTASGWAPGKTGIDRWGCALTSVAMLLQSYDIKTPAGETVTPPILNTWLKSQPDGYVGPGLLNWLAISRMVHQSRAAGHSTTDLEYTRTTYTPTTIKTTLDQNQPVILREAGHFVLAHGYSDTAWYLADPARESRNEASQSAAWISQHTYTPSNTDLSYLLFTAPTGVQVSLKDAQDASLPLERSDETVTDDVDGSGTTGAAMYLLPKPSSGAYLVTVQNTLLTPIDISGYWYDTEGNVGHATYPVDSAGTMQYRLVYDKTSTASGSLAPLDTTPPSNFDLIAPADNARTSAHDIVFSWNASSDTSLPLAYQLLVYDAQNQVVVDQTLAGLTTSATLPDGTYTWIVRACDSAANCTDSNGMRTLTIAPAPLLSAPRLVMAESVWKNIFLVWQSVRGAHHYLIHYGTDKDRLDKTVVSREPYAWLSVPKKGTYYLRVSAVDKLGNVGAPSKTVAVYVHGTFYPKWNFWH